MESRNDEAGQADQAMVGADHGLLWHTDQQPNISNQATAGAAFASGTGQTAICSGPYVAPGLRLGADYGSHAAANLTPGSIVYREGMPLYEVPLALRGLDNRVVSLEMQQKGSPIMTQQEARKVALQHAVAKYDFHDATGIVALAMAFENYLMYGILPVAQQPEGGEGGGSKSPSEAGKEGTAGQKKSRYLADDFLTR